MIHLGKGVDNKILKKIEDYLGPWLDDDEVIIGVFRASRWNPPSEGFVITTHKILILDKFLLKISKVVAEIAADDIHEFTSEKGRLKSRKSYIRKKDGAKVYLGLMYRDDALMLNDFLPQMSGSVNLVAEKIHNAKNIQSNDKKHREDDDTRQSIKRKDSSKKNKTKKIMRNMGFVLFWPSFIAYRLKIGKEIKEVKIREAHQRRESLHEDWKTIVATVAKLVKQHWNTLEVKFEQCIEEDDYGNKYIDSGFSSEIIYFSHKVVLPEIKKLIGEGRIKYFSFESIQAPKSVKKNLYQIKFSDEDSIIASKYVSGILSETGEGLINDDLLYALHMDDGLGIVSVENASNNLSSKSNLLTLEFEGSLQPNEPMKVTFISGMVFIIFYAMYNTRPVHGDSKHSIVQADFVGNNPYKYEEYVKELLRARGFHTKKTRSSGDFGVDVLANKNGISYAIQCKLYNRPVGTKAIQEIVSGRLHYNADYALVVSDNKFTEAAKLLARSTNVVLAHHKDLLRRIENLNASHQGTSSLRTSENTRKGENSHEQTAKRKWTQDDSDEIVTVILPTINND